MLLGSLDLYKCGSLFIGANFDVKDDVAEILSCSLMVLRLVFSL